MIHLIEGEHVLLERRHHWLPFVLETFLFVIIGAAPAFLLAFPEIIAPQVEVIIRAYQSAWSFFALAWFQVVWVIFFVEWTKYYLDVLVVTNRRVIDVEQVTLFHRDVAELRFEAIQDIRVEVRGLIASFFHYGDLYIQTAAENREFIIRMIPDPQEARDLIWQEHERARGHRPVLD